MKPVGLFCVLSGVAIAAGCAGTRAVPPIVAPTALDAPTSAKSVARASGGFAWARTILAGMSYAGPAHDAQPLRIYLAVRMRNASGLLRYASMASMPHSAVYRNFLTPTEIADRFAATRHDYTLVAAYFREHGMHVVTYPQRTLIQATGSVAQMARAFNTPFGRYRYPLGIALGPLRAPHFSRPLPVTVVLGLVRAIVPSAVSPIRGTVPNFAGLTPQQLANGFGYSGAYAVGYNGRGIVTGVIGTGERFAQDLSQYAATYGWPVARIQNVTPAPSGPPSSPGPGDTGEAAIDTQMVAALAPGAQEQWYVNNDYDDTGEIAMAIASNQADTISESAGSPESDDLATQSIDDAGTGPAQLQHAELAAEGIAYFASSGDNGSTTNSCTYTYLRSSCVTYPASDPNVVAVGGVDIPLDDAGNLIGEIVAWGTNQTNGGPEPTPPASACNCVGSGGGYSIVAHAPPWQVRALIHAPSAPFTGAREVPDIAMDAAAESGTGIVVEGRPGIGDGTSNAAPMANAMWALVLQACKRSPRCADAKGAEPYRLGNPAPLLYAIYRGRDRGRLSYKQVFYDVLYGMNQPVLPSPEPSVPAPVGYAAGPGFDLVTGLGVPFAGHLIDAVVPGVGVP